ncbi:hypothetical protein K3495_g2240 [Podosphaera aphanis]|nr:hypothetical protein K3495_g2240 [Podosphaera aphanis]
MTEQMRSENANLRFSYADNVGILGFGSTTAKSEVIQFPGRSRETVVGVRVNGTLIEPAEHIRWLGVNLDSRLNFKHHVTTWCEKALKAAQHMRRFNSTYRGAAPKALVRAVDTCIVPVATFRSEVWWPGLSRPPIRRTVTPQITGICEMIDKAILMGLRAALLVVRTTPNVVAHQERVIPPSKYILEGNRLRLAARLNTLGGRRPLRSRAAICPNDGIKRVKKNKKSARPGAPDVSSPAGIPRTSRSRASCTLTRADKPCEA